MSITFSSIVENNDEKTRQLDAEIETLSHLITPNHTFNGTEFEGKNPLTYQILHAERILFNLEEELKSKERRDQKYYTLYGENIKDQKHKKLKQKIKETKAELLKLRSDLTFIPAKIQRLKELKSSPAVCEITIQKAMSDATLKEAIANLERRMEYAQGGKERALLRNLREKLEIAKINRSSDITMHLLDSEVQYLKHQEINEKTLIIDLLKKIASTLEGELPSLEQDSPRQKNIKEALEATKKCILDLDIHLLSNSNAKDAFNTQSMHNALNALSHSTHATKKGFLTQLVDRLLSALNHLGIHIKRPRTSPLTHVFEKKKQDNLKRLKQLSPITEEKANLPAKKKKI